MYRSNENWPARIVFDFLSQSRYTVIDRAIRRTLPLRKRGTDQLSPRDNSFRSKHQKLQHFELAHSDPHRLAAEIQRNASESRHSINFVGLKI
jgi:hypothetical protein